jgi:hypothetical protein
MPVFVRRNKVRADSDFAGCEDVGRDPFRERTAQRLNRHRVREGMLLRRCRCESAHRHLDHRLAGAEVSRR